MEILLFSHDFLFFTIVIKTYKLLSYLIYKRSYLFSVGGFNTNTKKAVLT